MLLGKPPDSAKLFIFLLVIFLRQQCVGIPALKIVLSYFSKGVISDIILGKSNFL